MSRKNIVLLIVSFFSLSMLSICMEKKEKRIIPSMQKMMTIPCLDGENERKFELERWKVSESNSLLSHCLWYDLNFESVDGPLAVPKIPVQYKTLELFSKACDVTPGDQFKAFFERLKPEEQSELIIATGSIDKNGKRQFNAPGLIAQIFGACFKKDWCHEHIKPLMEREVWMDHCLSKVVNNNLTASLFPNSISIFKNDHEIMEHENGELSIVPLCLTTKGSLYDGPYTAMEKIIYDDTWKMLCYKKIDSGWEHCITSFETINSVNESPNNKAVIWAINNSNKNVAKTVVEHKDRILQCFFSKNGEYTITLSQEDIFVTKIIHMHDGSASFDTYRVDSSEYIMDVCFDNHTHRLVTCSAGDDRTGAVKLLDISGKCIASKTGLGIIETAVLSPDGNKLLTVSQIDEQKNIITLYTVADDIYYCGTISTLNEEDITLDRIICSPHSNCWAMVTNKGGIKFLIVSGAKYVMLDLLENSVVNQNNDMRILFSSDSSFLIALVQKEIGRQSILEVWSTFTGEKIVSQFSFCGQELDCGIGLTRSDRDLVSFYGNRGVYTRPFVCEQDDKILSYLYDCTTVYGLSLLRRLYGAHKNKQSIELYEEEPAYKALINMQKRPLNVVEFVKKYLSWKVIDNKKGVVLLAQEAWKNLFS